MSVPVKFFKKKYSEVWKEAVVGDRTIMFIFVKLRKIGDKHIKTIKGVGYK